MQNGKWQLLYFYQGVARDNAINHESRKYTEQLQIKTQGICIVRF